jgi:DNA-directed RNA polymerase subunit RPC12/RpoP
VEAEAVSIPSNAGTTTFQCGDCGAALVVEAGHRTATCPYCKSPSVIERPASRERPDPTFILPFTVTGAHARQAVERWTRRTRWLKQSLSQATIGEIQGIYVPAYLYSAVVRSDWSAEIGENYTTTETYTTTENGKTVTRTRTVTKTEWCSLSGDHVAYATDLLVSASRGLPNQELEEIEPFDLRALRRYAPALVSGWIAEEASLASAACVQAARGEAEAQEAKRLDEFMPGDKHRDLRYQMSVKDETIEPLLVPVWVLALRPDEKKPAMRVLANGQTAQVWGRERISALKVALWIGLVLALIGAYFLLGVVQR